MSENNGTNPDFYNLLIYLYVEMYAKSDPRTRTHTQIYS